MDEAMAVPKKAHAPADVVSSEAGQQEADADQPSKRTDEPDGSPCERWGRHRRGSRRYDFGLAHNEHFQTIQLVLGSEQKDPSYRAARQEAIGPICTPMSVAEGTHGHLGCGRPDCGVRCGMAVTGTPVLFGTPRNPHLDQNAGLSIPLDNLNPRCASFLGTLRPC